jgi:hypothetical protein
MNYTVAQKGGGHMFARLVTPASGDGSILIGACTWGTYPDKGADCIRGYFPHNGFCSAGKVPIMGP